LCGGEIRATWHDDLEDGECGWLRVNDALSADTFME
jgi:hypothetical protein